MPASSPPAAQTLGSACTWGQACEAVDLHAGVPSSTPSPSCSMDWPAQYEVGERQTGKLPSWSQPHAFLDPASRRTHTMLAAYQHTHQPLVACRGGTALGGCHTEERAAKAAEGSMLQRWQTMCCMWTHLLPQSARHDTERLQRECTCIANDRWHSPLSLPAQHRLGYLRLLLGGHSPHRHRCMARSSSSSSGCSGLRLCCCCL